MPLVSGDAKQLEWRAAAYLSQDKVAIQEILDQVDVHENNRASFGLPSRLIAKTYLFRLIFGGSAWSYANDADFADVKGGTEAFWQEVIERTYQKYEGLGTWHTDLLSTVKKNNGLLVVPTGRQYFYTPKMSRDGKEEWPRTTILNYPVQGLGADIMAISRVSLLKRMQRLRLKALFVCTVHDSLLIDCPSKEVDIVIQLMYAVFNDIPKNFRRLFKVDLNVPIEVEVQVGSNWGNMQDAY